MQDGGTWFIIRGDADLEDVSTILDLNLDEPTLKEFGTLSGYLCMCAGEIPKVGDFVMCRGWCFEVTGADEKRITTLAVEHLVGVDDDDLDHLESSGSSNKDGEDGTGSENDKRRKFLRKLSEYQEGRDEEPYYYRGDDALQDDDQYSNTAVNGDHETITDQGVGSGEAILIDKMVEGAERRKALVGEYRDLEDE
jgi:hypothetical protein